MAKYTKKPQSVEAIQYTGIEGLSEVEKFMGDEYKRVLVRPHSQTMLIDVGATNVVNVRIGDYIVKDFRLLHVTMKKEEFEALYEKVI